MKNNEMISLVFQERKKFVVIGLTGRTGSGCTTAAQHLENGLKGLPDARHVTYLGSNLLQNLDARRFEILKSYAEKNVKPFYSIKVSDLISAYILILDIETAANFIAGSMKNIVENDVRQALENAGFLKPEFRKKYKGMLDFFLIHSNERRLDDKEKEKLITFLKLIRKFTNDLKCELKSINNELYIYAYQAAGNSIRRTGTIQNGYEKIDFAPKSIFHLPETINRVIKGIRSVKDSALIVIDAIRNPYEASFFRDRYSAFYLVSINAPDKDRKSYLQNVHKFNVDNLNELDKRESGKNLSGDQVFVGQNVKKCIEISDIHIFNPRNELENNNVLKAQLAWYVALMLHPGLVSPTAMERVMQLAYTARSNSGCISRQVGAAITDKEFSVKAIGWNDVAKGQIPCALRSLDALENEFDPTSYSHFELNDPSFRLEAKNRLSHFRKINNLDGRNISYCFKDLKNTIDLNELKNAAEEKSINFNELKKVIDFKGNQVFTRSLHAEENAFLQLSKYGGPGINGGKLFTTASPCELCAKKAYQLGITEIYYIDPYPGIARDHILAVGSEPPKLIQFRGAVGHGYHRLYEPTLPYKDELEHLSTHSADGEQA